MRILRRIVKKSFWNAHDHLGACIVLNMLWLVLAAPWFFVSFVAFRLLVGWLGSVGFITGCFATLVALWLNPASLTILAAATAWADYRSAKGGNLWAFFRARLVHGLWLSFAGFLIATMLGVNAAVYLRLGGIWRWVGLMIAGIMLWAMLALAGVTFHLGLALARDRELRLREGIRRAVVLALTLPAQSLVLAGASVVLAVVLFFTGVGLPLMLFSLPAILAATGEREFLKRFRTYVPDQEEADHLEEVRSFRDLLHPWQMDR